MSWKPLKQLKKWTLGSAFGHKKASPLNPFTHGYWTARKVYRGVKRGKWQANLNKLMGMKRHANAYGANSARVYGLYASGSPSIYGPTGSIVGRY